uniref:Uncharacterized protein n=1 Tax=Octopus bimaculoides TaxID=37653 RepID=A0A0L8I2Q0_OCTBM
MTTGEGTGNGVSSCGRSVRCVLGRLCRRTRVDTKTATTMRKSRSCLMRSMKATESLCKAAYQLPKKQSIILPKASNKADGIQNADGTTLLTDENAVLERWTEHFNNVLNKPFSINAEAIAQMPQADINISLVTLPMEAEVQKAIKSLSNSKAPGSDFIAAETYNAGDQS